MFSFPFIISKYVELNDIKCIYFDISIIKIMHYFLLLNLHLNILLIFTYEFNFVSFKKFGYIILIYFKIQIRIHQSKEIYHNEYIRIE